MYGLGRALSTDGSWFWKVFIVNSFRDLPQFFKFALVLGQGFRQLMAACTDQDEPRLRWGVLWLLVALQPCGRRIGAQGSYNK